MAKTLDQINALRFYDGKEPLTELPAEILPENNDGQSHEQIKAELDQKEKEAADALQKEKGLAEAEKNPVNNEQDKEKEKEVPPVVIAATPTELDDAAIFEALKKRGINVNSFEDLAPKPIIDLEKEAEEKEAAKLSFALSKGLYSKKEYENYIRDTNDLQNLVYGDYYVEAKKENPELTDQEIQDNFLAEHGLDADPASSKYKRGVNKVALLADKMLKDKYGKIYTSDQEFEKYETEQKSQKEYKANILSKAPLYKKDVEDAVKDITKLIIPFSEQESIEATFKQEYIDSVKNQLLDEGYSIDQINKGWSKDAIKQTAYTALVIQNLSEIVKDVATKYLYKHQGGTRGIPQSGTLAPAADSETNLTENQKEALKTYRERMQLAEGAN